MGYTKLTFSKEKEIKDVEWHVMLMEKSNCYQHQLTKIT